jgi:hypothetical protein
MKCKGISPVIGEFMLVVCAILIGLPMIGFTFGTLGSFTQPAEVTVSSSSCGPDADPTDTLCNFALTNIGAGNTATEPTVIIYIHHGNQTRNSVTHSCGESGGVTLTAGMTLRLTCTFETDPGLPGDQYSGSIILTNNAAIPFVGRFS